MAPTVDPRLMLSVFFVPLGITLVVYVITLVRADSARELLELRRRI